MKKRISILLTIAGEGTKLQPFLIFKGKPGKNTDKNLKNNLHVIKGDIILYAKNENS